MKRQSTIEKLELVRNLNALDSKLKYNNSAWNERVKAAFNMTGSYSFENLVYTDTYTARSLYQEFKR
jgi:hypothetical protein